MKKFLIGIILVLTLVACANNQSAVSQITSQTSDPVMIAYAGWVDAQEIYIAAQKLWEPYKEFLKTSNPDLDAQLVTLFKQANDILNNWEKLGDIPIGDKTAFRTYIRQITLTLAQNM